MLGINIKTNNVTDKIISFQLKMLTGQGQGQSQIRSVQRQKYLFPIQNVIRNGSKYQNTCKCVLVLGPVCCHKTLGIKTNNVKNKINNYQFKM